MLNRSRTLLISFLVAVLSVAPATLGSVDAAGASGDGIGRHLMGMYPQWNAQAPNEFGGVAGRAVESLTLFLDRDSWAEMSSSTGGLLNLWDDHPSLKVISFPMSVNGESLAYGNSGANDTKIRDIAQRLVNGGFDGSVIRVGWEHNGSWSPWSSLDDPDAYSRYYRRIVDQFRAVSPNFRFEWNVNVRYVAVDMRSYPGDDYVDVIGMDIYNSSWGDSQRDPVDRWNTYLDRGAGLEWHRDFAASRGKPMAYSEWGLTDATRHESGVDPDDTYFIDQMLRWIAANNVAYANYFDSGWADLSDFPKAQAQYGRSMAVVPAATNPNVGGPTPTTRAPVVTTPTTRAPATTTTTTTPPAPTTTTSPYPPGVCRAPSNPVSVPSASSADGYWVLDASGRVHTRGNAAFWGDVRDRGLTVVAIAAHPDGAGYWIAESNGTIHAFGSARHRGDLRGISLAGPIQSLTPASNGSGYWMIGSDGGVFSFGVSFHGSMGGANLAAPIVSGAAGPASGYWLVGRDGGVFSFGVPFLGSTGGLALASPVSSLAAHPNGNGYWLYAQDGGVFAFGVPFYGSIPGLGLCSAPDAVELDVTRSGSGYWILATNGEVFAFGDAMNFGNVASTAVGAAIDIAVAL
jgi:hypothetical protein